MSVARPHPIASVGGDLARYLVVGEAPSAAVESRPGLWLFPSLRERPPRSGTRLWMLTGLERGSWLRRFDRTNLLVRAQGSSSGIKGDAFDVQAARWAAVGLHEEVERRAYYGVILLGRRVADALRWSREPGPPWAWGGRAPLLSWGHAKALGFADEAAFDAVVVPHPSAVNRWWSDASNREDFAMFFSALV